MQDPNLPDGCTQADIDRAMGAVSPKTEKVLEAAEAQYAQAALILEHLGSITAEVIGVFRSIIRAYDLAAMDLEAICKSAPPALVEAISGPLDEINCFDLPSPDAAVLQARKYFPSWEEVRADMLQDAGENPDG
jgi:hypothetical protein